MYKYIRILRFCESTHATEMDERMLQTEIRIDAISFEARQFLKGNRDEFRTFFPPRK